MWRFGSLFLFATTVSLTLHAQLSNSYTISDNQDFDKVNFSLNATNGDCYIEPGLESGVIDIQSKTEGKAKPSYTEEIVDRTKRVKVELTDGQNSSIGSALSMRMFNSSAENDYSWKLQLSKLKPLNLDLNYAVGDTYIDLSDLPIERLKMKTGSANVKVNYAEGFGNQMEMDTFMIKVDMGSFDASNLHLANSKNIIADVGFGKVKMDFEQAKMVKTEVCATVGAGKLEIILPKADVPVKINLNDSPLCNIKVPKKFEKLTESVFVSPGFKELDENHISFNVDVAVGHVVFKN